MSGVDLTLDGEDDDITGEPLEFLAAVMSGIDPRQKSEILQLVETIEAENFGDPPDDEQWQQLQALVKRLYTHQPVPISMSAAAARSLAEYRHAKRKSLEVTNAGEAVRITDLTDKELELFEAWFNDQF